MNENSGKGSHSYQLQAGAYAIKYEVRIQTIFFLKGSLLLAFSLTCKPHCAAISWLDNLGVGWGVQSLGLVGGRQAEGHGNI